MIRIDIAEPGYRPPPADPAYYILTKDGPMLRKRIGCVDALVPIPTISRLEALKPFISLNLPPLSPSLFGQIFLFFREICTRYESEALVLLYLDSARQAYRLYCPAQTVTRSSVTGESELEAEGFWRAGSIHSHARLPAYHSRTDRKDEESFDGLHITIGSVQSCDFSLAATVAVNGFRIPVPPEDFILGIRRVPQWTRANFGQITLPLYPPSSGGGAGKIYTPEPNRDLKSFNDCFELVEPNSDLGESYPKAWLEKVQPKLEGEDGK